MSHNKIIVVWRADRTIINSVYEFPPDRMTVSYPPKEIGHKSIIAARTKMLLFDGNMSITFDDNTVFINRSEDGQWNDLIVVYYIIYKTFLNYNCLLPMNENSATAPEADKVIFKLHHYIKRQVGTNGYTWDTEPCELVLNKKDIEDGLMAIDQTLLYAICYYLLGCDTQRYFLIEFYKCLEVIRNHFGNEKKLKSALRPHGFLEAIYKNAKKLANDQMNPLSMSRHAPLKGISVRSINTKWLFSDPVGRKTFEIGEKACRNIIDSYIRFCIAGSYSPRGKLVTGR